MWLSSKQLFNLSNFSFQTISWNIWRKSLTILDGELLLFLHLLAGSWPPWARSPATCSQSQESLRTPQLCSHTASQHHRALSGCGWLPAPLLTPCWALWLPAGTVITSTSPETYGDVCMGVVEEEAGVSRNPVSPYIILPLKVPKSSYGDIKKHPFPLCVQNLLSP